MLSLKTILSLYQSSSTVHYNNNSSTTSPFEFDCVLIVYSYESQSNKDKLFASLFSQYSYIKSLNENALIYFICNKYPLFVHKKFSYLLKPSEIIMKEILEYNPNVINLLKKYSKRGKITVNNKDIEIKTNGKQITFFINCQLGIGIDYMMNYVYNEIVDRELNFILPFRDNKREENIMNSQLSLDSMIFDNIIDKTTKISHLKEKKRKKKENKRFLLNCCNFSSIKNDDNEEDEEDDEEENEYDDNDDNQRENINNNKQKNIISNGNDIIDSQINRNPSTIANEYTKENDYDIGIHLMNKLNKPSNQDHFLSIIPSSNKPSSRQISTIKPKPQASIKPQEKEEQKQSCFII